MERKDAGMRVIAELETPISHDGLLMLDGILSATVERGDMPLAKWGKNARADWMNRHTTRWVYLATALLDASTPTRLQWLAFGDVEAVADLLEGVELITAGSGSNVRDWQVTPAPAVTKIVVARLRPIPAEVCPWAREGRPIRFVPRPPYWMRNFEADCVLAGNAGGFRILEVRP